jgi:hypothetical protein
VRPRRRRELESALTKKGFRLENTHHRKYRLYVDELKTSVSTKVSHGHKEVGEKLLALMARQMHLAGTDFERFADCPMAGAEYVALLVAEGHVRLD